ncbi:MAG TPA: SRPBCC family protein [Fimbriiglobus sp.]|nr:SRPBCC family protein [Fimbriiglobus sp.]
MTEPTAPADREIVSTRVFDTPRDLVFRAFADPDRLARWWGPRGFTNTIHEFDLRPGGAWRLTMHAPNGADYQNESVFVEVAEPERVVFQHLEPVHRFRMTITLDDEGGKTRLTWRMLFESAEEFDRVQSFVAEANEQNFDRLAEELART